MRLLVVGTADAFSTERFGSSAMVEGAQGRVLIDCPDMIGAALRKAREASGWDVDVLSVTDIVLTHLHGDHCNGLESLGFRRWLQREADGHPLPRLHCWGPVADRLWERLAPAMDQGGRASLATYFELHRLHADRESLIAGMRVACRPTGHSVPTTALRLRCGDRVLGWSADTPFDAGLIEWLMDRADLVVHEVSPGPFHTPVESLNGLPADVRNRLRLIHMPDDFDPACTTIACLQQGQVLEI
jgi:ribonuclease BN (tRNA processing enzyme)